MYTIKEFFKILSYIIIYLSTLITAAIITTSAQSKIFKIEDIEIYEPFNANFNKEILNETDLLILLNENPEEFIQREQIEFLKDQNITLCWFQNNKIETFDENQSNIKWLL